MHLLLSLIVPMTSIMINPTIRLPPNLLIYYSYIVLEIIYAYSKCILHYTFVMVPFSILYYMGYVGLC